MQKIVQYLKDVQAEMLKVSWPTRDELVGSTTVVIVTTIIIALIVKFFDTVLSKVLGFILNM